MAKKENDNRKVLEIKFEGAKWEKAQDDAFKKNVANVTIDGFRKGKCPKDVFLKKYGKESLYIDAAESLVGDAYDEAIKDNKDIVPVVQPRVDIKAIDEKGVTFTFTFITSPAVKIKKYKGLKVKKEEVKVTKEEIKHELEHLLEQYTELVVKDGKVAKGDIAIIDFEGFKDGKAFDGGKGENYSLEIGSNTFIPGFEDQLVGMKKGEEKEIKVTFPKEYGAEDLAGKDATFKVKVNEIKTKEKRELDKDFFEDLGMEGIDSKESLEKEIEANIKANKDMEAENKYIDKLLEEVSKNVEVDIPEEMVDDEVHRMIHQFEQQLAMQGLSLDMYYKFTNSDHEALHQQMEHDAYQHVLYRLMLEEIIKLEKIVVTDKDVEDEIKLLEEKYKMVKEDILKQLGSTEMIKYDLEMRKVIDLLKEANK